MGKTIGGIFLVVGISIGAGILALPITTSTSGFFPSTILMFLCWALMTVNALLVLEVNLWLPENSNIISMARATLGPAGSVVAWISYLFLFYALLAAYILAGTDVASGIFSTIEVNMPDWLDALLFTGFLAAIVYRGTSSIDHVNRILVYIKFVVFFLLLFGIVKYIKLPLLLEGNIRYVLSPLMIMITSFGFASIVPSLRTYFKGDAKKLRFVIIVGSLIPLMFYILWDLAILGSLPLEGDNGLRHILNSKHTTSTMIISLNTMIGNGMVTNAARLFSSICVTTSFLGVALALSDFLADGLKIQKQGRGKLIVYAFTYVPPLFAVLFWQSAFLMALNYAGTFCTVLLAVMPGLMVWRGRYVKNLSTGGFQLPGGKPLIIVLLIASVSAVCVGVMLELHLLYA